jgi:CO/xanthine dehydrogenase Mo-binding subunit
MPGAHSIHRLPGAVAVVADRWWHARRAVETLQVTWTDQTAATQRVMPADFSSDGRKAMLAAAPGPGFAAETAGDVAAALGGAARVVSASYNAPYLAHGQLEPPSAAARWNEDGTLDLWLPNQAPEMFQAAAATVAGVTPDKVRLHSPLLGGFFGRHFLYEPANPFPEAILLAKAVGRPVKIIWSREEEFLRTPCGRWALRVFGAAWTRTASLSRSRPRRSAKGRSTAGSAARRASPTVRPWKASPGSPMRSRTAAWLMFSSTTRTSSASGARSAIP